MPMVYENDKWVLRCGACNTLNPQAWYQGADREACSDCSKIVDTSPRDSMGQKVRVATEHLGKYSYATDTVINSARSYADHLKKNGLVLKKP